MKNHHPWRKRTKIILLYSLLSMMGVMLSACMNQQLSYAPMLNPEVARTSGLNQLLSADRLHGKPYLVFTHPDFKLLVYAMRNETLANDIDVFIDLPYSKRELTTRLSHIELHFSGRYYQPQYVELLHDSDGAPKRMLRYTKAHLQQTLLVKSYPNSYQLHYHLPVPAKHFTLYINGLMNDGVAISIPGISFQYSPHKLFHIGALKDPTKIFSAY